MKGKNKKEISGPLKTENAPAEFLEDVAGLLAHLELERGLSKHTLAAYEADLVQCARHLHGMGAAGWRAAKPEQVSAWLGALTKAGYAAASLATGFLAVWAGLWAARAIPSPRGAQTP